MLTSITIVAIVTRTYIMYGLCLFPGPADNSVCRLCILGSRSLVRVHVSEIDFPMGFAGSGGVTNGGSKHVLVITNKRREENRQWSSSFKSFNAATTISRAGKLTVFFFTGRHQGLPHLAIAKS